MSDSNGLSSILEQSVNKSVILFLNNGFVYNCRIVRVWSDWVQFLDLKKHYSKIIKVSDIKEVQFL